MTTFTEHFYSTLGFTIFWIIGVFVILLIIYWISKLILEAIAERTKTLWKFVEFLYYYREFKDFVGKKDDRHPKAK